MKGAPIEQKELEFIKSNYLKMSDRELSKEINRTLVATKHIRQRNRLYRGNSNVHFSKNDISYIKANFNTLSDDDMAKVLKRSKYSVKNKRYRLGCRRQRCIRNKDFVPTKKLIRMQELIKICETTQSPYRLELAKTELRKLSGL